MTTGLWEGFWTMISVAETLYHRPIPCNSPSSAQDISEQI